jgi:hypothetical protein
MGTRKPSIIDRIADRSRASLSSMIIFLIISVMMLGRPVSDVAPQLRRRDWGGLVCVHQKPGKSSLSARRATSSGPPARGLGTTAPQAKAVDDRTGDGSAKGKNEPGVGTGDGGGRAGSPTMSPF